MEYKEQNQRIWDNFDYKNKNFWIKLAIFKFILVVFVAKQHSLYADEYNQLTEMVYNQVYGGTLKSFEWKEGLRSIIQIEIYAFLLRLLNFLHLDTILIVQYNIYLIHIFYSLIGDYLFIQYGENYFGRQYVKIAFLLRISSAIYIDFHIRPFMNIMEESLFLLGMYYFKKVYDNPENSITQNDAIILSIVLPIAFIIRNTFCILWICPLIWILFNRLKYVKYFFISSFFVLLINIFLDYLYYNRWILPFWNFIKFNHDQNWHESPYFHFIISVPAFLLIMTPFSLNGFWKHFEECRNKKQIAWPQLISIVFISILSLMGHKEIRFIIPILPSFFYFAAYSIHNNSKSLDSSRKFNRLLQINLVFNAIVLLVLSRNLKVYAPIIKAVKNVPEIKKLQIFSFYDFPMYTEFHNSNIEISYEICEFMHKMFEDKYDHIIHEYQPESKNYTVNQMQQTWIDAVKSQGNQHLPEWVLAPKFINQCSSRQHVLDSLYDRYQEIFYEIDLMQLRQLNWDHIHINYIIFRKKHFDNDLKNKKIK